MPVSVINETASIDPSKSIEISSRNHLFIKKRFCLKDRRLYHYPIALRVRFRELH